MPRSAWCNSVAARNSNAGNRRSPGRYDEAFQNLEGISLIQKSIGETFVYSYTLRVLGGRRDALIAHLRQLGIGTSVHYHPNHLQPQFMQPGLRLPVTEEVFGELLSLPLYIGLTEEEIEQIVAEVSSFVSQSAAWSR